MRALWRYLMNKFEYKFSTEKKMLATVDRIEQGCQEHGLYYLGGGLEFNYEKDENEKSVRIVLFDGYNGGCPLKMLYAYLSTKGRNAMVKMFEDSNFHIL
jgi:hypothetical protein